MTKSILLGKIRQSFLVGFLAMGSSSVFAKVFDLDLAHSSVGFSVRHMGLSTVEGRFKEFTGKFDFDPEKGTFKSAEATIWVHSIDTDDLKRDEHLRTDDFFGIDLKNPKDEKNTKNTIKFNLVSFEPGSPGKAKGTITMKGVSKPIELAVIHEGYLPKDPSGNERVGFTATGKLNRKDFGINFSKLLDHGGAVVGDEVDLRIKAEGIIKAAPAGKK